jgi:2-polyprenyl-3-methyl-5-hydroxy-6-metoxy-1,4-benzoquinol methylase
MWQVNMRKVKYLLWAARRWPFADTTCPACASPLTEPLKRKALVTGLYNCQNCRLMFRVPKNTAEETDAFYQEEYREGFTTDCPSEKDLSILIDNSFRGSEKDYSEYVKVVRAAGIEPGQVLLDFGSSWGYGSWQLATAGFQVYSFEVSRPRARYAAEKLSNRMLERPEEIPERADCFFSAHVIEHLPNPRLLWEKAASVLKPNGVVILFMPNGESSLAKRKKDYHSIWGQVHPLLLSAAALSNMANEFGFRGSAYSSPFDLPAIAERRPGLLSGDELLFVARRE